MCLDALRDHGLTWINIGIACAHGVSFAAVLPLDFKNQLRFFKQKKTKNQIKKPSSNLQIPSKLTHKCCIILHYVQT